jgi:hypothetical protein
MPKPARLFAEIFGSQPRRTIIRTFDITEMAPVVMRLAETDAGFDPPLAPAPAYRAGHTNRLRRLALAVCTAGRNFRRPERSG